MSGSILDGAGRGNILPRRKRRIFLWLLLGGLIVLWFGAFVPPILAKNGFHSAARVGYWLYRPICHEKGYRSFFLFGAQRVYPLALAGASVGMNYERVLESGEPIYRAAGEFYGDDRFGYKAALCQRDLAIIGGMAIFIAGFLIFRRRIRPIPFWIWIFCGCAPMAIDGGSQFLPAFWTAQERLRESTWELRVLTGLIFGVSTAWLALSYLEKKDGLCQ